MPPKSNKISIDEIHRLCELAKINLSAREESLFSKELNEILGYFSMLDKADVKTIVKAPGKNENKSLRDDVAFAFSPEEMIRSVPQKKYRYVKGQKMM